MAANTPVTYYLDTPAVKAACAEDFAKIDKACKPEPKASEKNKHPMLKKMLGAKRVAALERLTNKIKSKHNYQEGDKNAWMSHCDGLWVKPDMGGYAKEIEEFSRQIKGMAGDLGGYIRRELGPMLERYKAKIGDAAWAAAKKKAEQSAGRWAAGLLGGPFAEATELIATAWNIYDWANTGIEAVRMAPGVYSQIKEMGSILEIAQKAQSELAELAGSMADKSPTDLMAEGMGILSRLNPCTRARRCRLVKYGKTGTLESMGGEGCCPGQTGHHVIPDEAAKAGCSPYSKDGAPTVCVEGTNNYNGTHGKIHSDLENRVARYRKGLFGGDTASYGKMRDMGIDSVQRTFPESRCSIKCLRAQLDAYYKDKCSGPMPATAGMPKGQGASNKRK
jgi:hypothetical protein